MDESELYWLDASAQAELIRTGQVSAVQVMQSHLDRIAAVNPKVNAMVTVLAEPALEAARSADESLAAGAPIGPLHGVPFTAKDSLDVAGVVTTRGSALFRDHVPVIDATAVARLRAAGAILLGKTNLPEFSYWTETDNLLIGRSHNPWDDQRTPGGSSGGESAAIAAGMSPLGLGSDVAISVRGPAHDTGIVALKATRDGFRSPGTGPRFHGATGMSARWPAACKTSRSRLEFLPAQTAPTAIYDTGLFTMSGPATLPGYGWAGPRSRRSDRWIAK